MKKSADIFRNAANAAAATECGETGKGPDGLACAVVKN